MRGQLALVLNDSLHPSHEGVNRGAWVALAVVNAHEADKRGEGRFQFGQELPGAVGQPAIHSGSNHGWHGSPGRELDGNLSQGLS